MDVLRASNAEVASSTLVKGSKYLPIVKLDIIRPCEGFVRGSNPLRGTKQCRSGRESMQQSAKLFLRRLDSGLRLQYSLVALTFKSAFFAKRDGGGNPSEGAKLRVRSS